VARLQASMDTPAPLLGLVLTLVDYRARATRELVAMIRGQYGARVFTTEIRVNVRLSEAPSFGQPIFAYAATSAGAEAYRRLVAELLARCPPAGTPAGRQAGKQAGRHAGKKAKNDAEA
jgi:chromosome partitioning protein